MLKKTDPSMIQDYLEDSSGLRGGHAEEVALPANEKEVSQYLLEAAAGKKPVTISGGGTGVTGGRIPFGGSVLSTEKFSKILDLDNEIIRVQSGVRLEEIINAARGAGWLYPPDATEHNAFIGGNISTNASGARSYKYGATRKYVRRLKIVLANGKSLDLKRNGDLLDPKLVPHYQMPNCKNAAGYFSCPNMEEIDLFIGSEGTLGVVIEAELQLLKRQGELFGCFAFFDHEASALNFAEQAKKQKVLALEYFDANSLNLLRPKFPKLPQKAVSLVFFEQDTAPNLEVWEKLLEKAIDTWTAGNEAELKEFENIRHSLPELVNEIVKRRGIPKIGTDIAVPAKAFKEMLDYYHEHLEKLELDHLLFGHIGNSHLHVNVLPNNQEERDKTKALYMKFVQKAVELGGTVSAEHGIGKLKHDFLKVMYGQKGIDEMIRVKKEFDPACILGLGNIFPKKLLL